MKEEKPKSKKGSKKPKNEKDQRVEKENDFDFGGFPKDVSFKRNMGCGG